MSDLDYYIRDPITYETFRDLVQMKCCIRLMKRRRRPAHFAIVLSHVVGLKKQKPISNWQI